MNKYLFKESLSILAQEALTLYDVPEAFKLYKTLFLLGLLYNYFFKIIYTIL